MDLTKRYGQRERGSATVEYAGIILVVVAIIAVLVVSGLGSTVATKLGCAVRSVGTQAGTCGGPEVPTTYDADGDGVGATGDQPTRIDDGGASDTGGDPVDYDTATPSTDTVDQDAVDEALDDVRDALDGGFFGVRGGDLDDAMEALEGLNGSELDALIASMSDDELRHWINELEDGWVGGGWDREKRRELWELIVGKANKATLDRLAGLTDEIQPSFDDVGGDGARDDPESVANTAEYEEVNHQLVVGGIRPMDIAQGAIGDCWYMASLMAIAQADPSVIADAISQNANGTYTVRLYDDGKPVYVTVTPDMVVREDNPAFSYQSPQKLADGTQGYELWPLVMEKALALHWGDYADIEGDSPGLGLEVVTGQSSSSSSLDDAPSVSELDSLLDGGGAVTLASHGEGDDLPDTYGDAADGGLVTGHAYYVKSVNTKKGTVTVVNPWGSAYAPITLTYAEFQDSFSTIYTNGVAR
ncbi:C2 family cysteine protease [Cellulomonas humilata]|uniref:Flp pilus assembly pilin Flp n=1 Tax=Cellulomonas humilata TaxID=144055 RepID=A0ABU0EJ67_9CELL|nr:C2 family cysteine protease [Cellulomonas humilata]MDQ0375329.1 Flp pilus assembly pilin Flp [Cellulomonas humilata]